LNKSDISGLRNTADIFVRRLFSLFDIYGFYAVGFLVFLFLFISYYLHIKNNQNGKVKYSFFLLMLLESVLYAILMIIILNKSQIFLSSSGLINSKNKAIVLALGAGVYEEFVFRVIVVTISLFFFNKILRLKKYISTILTILLASTSFSIFHYLGPNGEIFQLSTFILRSLAGLLLSVIYIFRGYGVTAYTHSIYDLILLYI